MRIDTTKRLSRPELESPIANYITPCQFNFRVDQTVEDVLKTLQSKETKKEVGYFYITDKNNVLQGIVTLPDILYNAPKTALIDIIDPDVLKVHDDEPLENGLKVLMTHKILSIPVINRDNRFLGILEVMLHESEDFYKSKKIHNKSLKEDIFQFIGFSIEQRKRDSPWIEFRYRMPWLLCNLVGGLICAVISDFYEVTLAKFVILAVFIPLVLALSESVAIQSMTLSLRFLHLRNIRWVQVWRRIFIEAKTSFLLGVASAILICFFYFAWSVDLKPVIAISLSIVFATMIAALFGTAFPIILHALRLDPKVAAGPVVLMMADIITITVYLSLSTFLLIS